METFWKKEKGIRDDIPSGAVCHVMAISQPLHQSIKDLGHNFRTRSILMVGLTEAASGNTRDDYMETGSTIGRGRRQEIDDLDDFDDTARPAVAIQERNHVGRGRCRTLVDEMKSQWRMRRGGVDDGSILRKAIVEESLPLSPVVLPEPDPQQASEISCLETGI